MKLKELAIRNFIRTPLKHPMSKYLLQFILDTPDLLKRITFVRNREYLPNTMLISELGSPRVGFELELGVHQREEVRIVNGELIRRLRRERHLCINEPMEAIAPLRTFRSELYVTFAFCGPMPAWYLDVLESSPSLPESSVANVNAVLREIVREQLDLAVQAILTKAAIDQALAERDPDSFRRNSRIYREIMSRCLWQL
ncbi:MAG: hypothetical protein GX162_08545 [Firmicutes bacterium]|jgi:uncharacterized protein YpiB (UPF0302 family)|nr:hypothetical protein [Bacillota bacterium]